MYGLEYDPQHCKKREEQKNLRWHRHPDHSRLIKATLSNLKDLKLCVQSGLLTSYYLKLSRNPEEVLSCIYKTKILSVAGVRALTWINRSQKESIDAQKKHKQLWPQRAWMLAGVPTPACLSSLAVCDLLGFFPFFLCDHLCHRCSLISAWHSLSFSVLHALFLLLYWYLPFCPFPFLPLLFIVSSPSLCIHSIFLPRQKSISTWYKLSALIVFQVSNQRRKDTLTPVIKIQRKIPSYLRLHS
jgi:hypothetical protein